MTKEELYAHPGWDWCTFEGARKQVLLIGLTTTFREKLEWLEQAENISLLFKINRERRAAEEETDSQSGIDRERKRKPSDL